MRITNVETAFFLGGGVSPVSIVDAEISNAVVGITTKSSSTQMTLDGAVFSNVSQPLYVNGTSFGDETTTGLSYVFERSANGSFVKGGGLNFHNAQRRCWTPSLESSSA